MENPQAEKEKFIEILKKFDTGVLITHGEQTPFHARPMAIADVDDNGDVWFVTGQDSPKVHEILDDSRVEVVCQSGFSSCATLSGHATVTQDRAKIHELWKPSYKAWFPNGKDDPNIALVHVRGESAEYWDNSGINSLKYLYQNLKAVLTHSTPEVNDDSQNAKVTLN